MYTLKINVKARFNVQGSLTSLPGCWLEEGVLFLFLFFPIFSACLVDARAGVDDTLESSS